MSLFPLHIKEAVVRAGGRTILGPISLEVKGHRATLIIGPNGSGKTTLLRLIHGLNTPKGGGLIWPVSLEQARQRQAFVFQTPILLRRTVIGNIAYPLELRGMRRSTAREKASAWAQRVGLSAMADQPAAVLSGGEKQKLALARALIAEPDLLLLDEPTTNLDGRATREIEEILQQTAAQGTTLLMATHDMGQAERLADDVIFLFHGTVHELGAAAQFFAHPQTAEARAFLKGDIVE
ncbi:MAG: ATP-binding cassette domain-containing protein [Pseudomonadota bacterium]